MIRCTCLANVSVTSIYEIEQLHKINNKCLLQVVDLLKKIYKQFSIESQEGRVKHIQNPLKRLSVATGNNDFVSNRQLYFCNKNI